MTHRYAAADLRALGEALLRAGGLEAEKAATVARVLVEADLLGHTTHGLALCAGYVRELEQGAMTASGGPEILTDRGAVAVWDGRRLPGPWLVEQAIDTASAKARSLGMGAVAIRRSHHIACLAAFLERPARDGLMVMVASSDPAGCSVAPFGGLSPVMTPNPVAIGYPAGDAPVMIDISASITTNAMCGRVAAAGERLPGKWLIGADGAPTDDPARLNEDPPAALLPAGGVDHGQKGYGLGLFVEAATQGLGGFGRAEAPSGWGASVLVQVYDPALFAGLDAFTRETAHLAAACRAARPIDPDRPVRLPGQAGLARKRMAAEAGVPLAGGIVQALAEAAARHGVEMPRALPD